MAETRDALLTCRDWAVQVLDLPVVGTMTRRRYLLALPRLIRQIARADLWYHTGLWLSLRQGLLLRIAMTVRTRVVIQWIGSDVLHIARHLGKRSGAPFVLEDCIHWVCAPWLVDELRNIGIESSYVPLPSKTAMRFLALDPPALPSSFSILTYIPNRRAAFYGWRSIVRLAQEFPDVEIRVVSGDGSFVTDCPPNIRFDGWVKDMYAEYSNCTVLVRMADHDGLSMMVQEALILERHVVWNYPFPGALHAPDDSALCNHIQDLLDRHYKGILQKNEVGREQIRSHFEPGLLAAQMRERMQKCVG